MKCSRSTKLLRTRLLKPQGGAPAGFGGIFRHLVVGQCGSHRSDTHSCWGRTAHTGIVSLKSFSLRSLFNLSEDRFIALFPKHSTMLPSPNPPSAETCIPLSSLQPTNVWPVPPVHLDKASHIISRLLMMLSTGSMLAPALGTAHSLP